MKFLLNKGMLGIVHDEVDCADNSFDTLGETIFLDFTEIGS